nr:immunoglobulin light chain junction region [Macaca mulatta]
CLQYRSFPYSF